MICEELSSRIPVHVSQTCNCSKLVLFYVLFFKNGLHHGQRMSRPSPATNQSHHKGCPSPSWLASQDLIDNLSSEQDVNITNMSDQTLNTKETQTDGGSTLLPLGAPYRTRLPRRPRTPMPSKNENTPPRAWIAPEMIPNF